MAINPFAPEQDQCSFCGKTKKEVKKLIAGPNVFICDECISESAQMLRQSELKNPLGAENSPLPTPSKIVEHLNEYVIGQEKPKQVLAVAVYNHYKRLRTHSIVNDVEISKSNILMLGPTGSGKTLLAQTLARLLKVPFAIADATTLTEAGYVGEDVEHVIQKLVQNADGDIQAAEQGIVYLDEIDKIARKSANPSITRDVSGEGVQQALLKIIEGTTASVPPTGKRKHPGTDFLSVKTDNILFICGGAFDGLEKIVAARKDKGGIGFNATVAKQKDSFSNDLLQEVEPDDLIKFGLIPELIGRLPIVTALNDLDKDALVSILVTPKNALIKQYQALLHLDGAELEVSKDALGALADKALQRKTGVRGLRSALEEVMLPLMYEVPDQPQLKKIILDADCVNKGTVPHKIYAQEMKGTG